jgi:hypothetical protein
VLTTCGATDNLETGCGRAGLDIVFAVRVATRGTVTLTYTAPRGVSLWIGFDPIGGGTCRDRSVSRVCVGGSDASNTRMSSAMLLAGTYYVYAATSVAATIVVDAQLP